MDEVKELIRLEYVYRSKAHSFAEKAEEYSALADECIRRLYEGSEDEADTD